MSAEVGTRVAVDRGRQELVDTGASANVDPGAVPRLDRTRTAAPEGAGLRGARLYSDIDQMLEPAELSRLLERDVETVATESVEGLPTSTQAKFLAISIDEEPEPSLMVKRVDHAADWVALFTEDTERRAVRLWSEGALERMPATVSHSVIACGESAVGYGILMPHLGSSIPETSVPMPGWMDDHILDAMAAMHAAYWEDQRLGDPAMGLCTIETQISNLSPRRAHQLAAERPDVAGWDEWITANWEETLPEVIDPGLARDLQALVDDPRPIADALAPYPRTLVHGDIRSANVAVSRNGGPGPCHFFDWGRSAFAAPAADLGWYLGFTSIERPMSLDQRIATYEQGLRAHLGVQNLGPDWERQREIGLLAGASQSSLGCRPGWLRWETDGVDPEHVEAERWAIRAWASRFRATMDLL